MAAARLRVGAKWSDACILNVSSRGLMIHAAGPLAEGSLVMLHHGRHALACRVVWRSGARAGLNATGLVPVEEIMTGGAQVPARAGADRRRRPRVAAADRSRIQARLLQFAGVAAIAIAMGSALSVMAAAALARPLAAVAAALN